MSDKDEMTFDHPILHIRDVSLASGLGGFSQTETHRQ